MQEILRSDTENVVIPLPISGSPSNIYSVVTDLDTLQQVFSGSPIYSGSSGYFNLNFDEDSSSYDRKVKIVTTASYNTTASTFTNFFEINRPFATLNKLREDIEFPNPVSDRKLLTEERRIRTYIQSEVLENFYKENKIVVAYGEDSDVLYIDKRILFIDSIYENDVLIYTASTDAISASYLSESDVDKYAIKAVGAPTTSSDVVNISYQTGTGDRVFEHTGIYLITYDQLFKKNTKYTVKGIFGWDSVPSEIEMATTMMVEDRFCRDIAVRNKNIQKLQNDAYTIEYADGFQDGSGNILADHIIQKFKSLRINPRII